MIRYLTLSAALVFASLANAARGQDVDEVKRLNDRIALLEQQLDLAKQENELLRREIEQLKGGDPKPEPAKTKQRASLADRIPAGTVLTGTYAYLAPNGERGTATLTITEQDGKNVRGTYRPTSSTGEVYPGFDFVGTLTKSTLTVMSVGSAVRKKLILTLNGNGLEGKALLIDKNLQARVGFTLDK